ncbi:Uncharacterised protein [Serratia fonticola]|nr:Uncharacterised protein [Serratia fonticola]
MNIGHRDHIVRQSIRQVPNDLLFVQGNIRNIVGN